MLRLSNGTTDSSLNMDIFNTTLTTDINNLLVDTINSTSYDYNSTYLTTSDISPLTAHDVTTVASLSPEPKYWKLGLAIVPLFTLFGNLLICLSVYREKQLQTVTNYFIVSLAVADLMVASLVMPLAVYFEVSAT